MTDWEKQLQRRRATIRRAETALEEDIADAHEQGGLSWRKIGAAAEVNHEWARQAADRVAKRRAAGMQPTDASRDQERAERVRAAVAKAKNAVGHLLDDSED